MDSDQEIEAHAKIDSKNEWENRYKSGTGKVTELLASQTAATKKQKEAGKKRSKEQKGKFLRGKAQNLLKESVGNKKF